MRLIVLSVLTVALAAAQYYPPSGGGGGSMTWPSTPGITVCTGTPCTAYGTSIIFDLDGALAADSDTRIPSQKALVTYIAAGLAGKPTAALVTSVGSPGLDTNVASEKAVATGLATKAASNASTTVNGQTCALGSTCTVPGATYPIGAVFDGQGSAISTGKPVYLTYVGPSCTISAWNITVDTGTATVDAWKIATGTAIPTVSNSITASATPAIATGTALHSTTLSGWTTSVSQNDIFGFNVKTLASATKVSLILQCQ